MHTVSLKPHNLEGRHASHSCFTDEERCSERSSHLLEVTQPTEWERRIRSWNLSAKPVIKNKTNPYSAFYSQDQQGTE